MGDQKRGDDAADHAPRPVRNGAEKPEPASDKQDSPNYADREDGGRAVPTESINSANDE